MQALRNIYIVKNNRITIDLPENFRYSSVEIIILPIEKPIEQQYKNVGSKEKRLKQLLAVNTWTENDIQAITDTQNLINQWKIQEF